MLPSSSYITTSEAIRSFSYGQISFKFNLAFLMKYKYIHICYDSASTTDFEWNSVVSLCDVSLWEGLQELAKLKIHQAKTRCGSYY